MNAITPEQAQKATDKLIKWLQVDQRIVTYRELSRGVRIQVNIAKNLLLQYLSTHPDVFPTYLLTGELLRPVENGSSQSTDGNEDNMDVDVPSPKSLSGEEAKPGFRKRGSGEGATEAERVLQIGMMLIGGDQVQAKKALFKPDTLRMQIWSLSPSRVSDPAHYLPSTTRLRSYPKYHDPKTYGTITGDFEMEKVVNGPSKPQTSSAVMDTKPSASKLDKAAAPTGSKSGASTGIKGMFGNMAAKKEKEEIVKKEKETIKEKAKLGDAAKKGKGKSKEEDPKAAPIAKPKKNAKNVVLSDDEEEVPEKVSKMQHAAEDQAALEALVNMPFDAPSSDPVAADTGNSVKLNPKGKKRTSEAAQNPTSEDDSKAGGSGRIRKKRRVVRTVASTDAKGYACFDDVSSVESYSSDDASAKIAHKPTGKPKGSATSASAASSSTKPKPAATKAKGKATGKLESFFTKKG